jgi:hypothetical protein
MLFYSATPLLSARPSPAPPDRPPRPPQIGSPWRKLGCGQQTGPTCAGVTIRLVDRRFRRQHRYRLELSHRPPAAWSPKFRQALEQARQAGHAYLVIDATLIPIGRRGIKSAAARKRSVQLRRRGGVRSCRR